MSLAIAHRLRALGLSVIPVPRPRPGARSHEPGDGKVPAIPWKEFQTRLPTSNELRVWFSAEPVNLAVVTGAISGVVVVDADSPDALRWCTRNLPYTPWQTQTARGFHLWYQHPGIPIRNRARVETRDGRRAIDVKGDGGFVIVAPSAHARLDADDRVVGIDGHYTDAGDWTAPRRDLPRFWSGWIARPTRPGVARPANPRPTGDVVERARRYLAAIPRPEIGHGSDNTTLYAACRLVRGFDLSATAAEALIWEWAGGRSGWTRAWVAEKVRHAQRYGTEPVGALR